MREHVLKCWPDPYREIAEGRKRSEYRRDDRGYEVGDVLVLQEWVPMIGDAPPRYTGKELRREVTHISRGPAWDIPAGYVVMSIATLAVPAGVCLCVHAPEQHRPDGCEILGCLCPWDGQLRACRHCGVYPLVLFKAPGREAQRLPGKCKACGARQ